MPIMMSEIQSIFTVLFILSGIFFLLIGSIGIIRLPDFYSRTHATSKSDTLGLMLIIAGLIIFEGLNLNSAKLLMVLIFIALANPIGSHALARAAHKTGVKPYFTETQEENQA